MNKIKKRITKHARKRLGERAGVYDNYARLLNNVLKKGHPPNRYSGLFYSYLSNKTNSSSIRVYKEKIYVFSPSKKKKLLTTFPVPSMYLPTRKYLISKSIYKKVGFLLRKAGISMKITLKNNEVLEGVVVFNEKYPRDKFDFGLKDGTIIKVMACELLEIELEDGLKINN